MKRVLIGNIAAILVVVAAPLAAANAADRPVKALKSSPPACVWCGWYGGLNAGYGWSANRVSTASTPTPDATLGVVSGVSAGLSALAATGAPVAINSSLIGGAQVGFNRRSGRWLTGLEADIQGLSASDGARSITSSAVVVGVPILSTQTVTASTSYLGTLRARVGFLAAPRWLVYGTGGLAFGGVKASETLVQTGTNGFSGAGAGAMSATRAGWVAGFGAERMLASKWSWKAEYLHYDLGAGRLTSSPAAAFFATPIYQTNVSSVHFQGDIVRVGVSYHF